MTLYSVHTVSRLWRGIYFPLCIWSTRIACGLCFQSAWKLRVPIFRLVYLLWASHQWIRPQCCFMIMMNFSMRMCS